MISVEAFPSIEALSQRVEPVHANQRLYLLGNDHSGVFVESVLLQAFPYFGVPAVVLAQQMLAELGAGEDQLVGQFLVLLVGSFQFFA